MPDETKPLPPNFRLLSHAEQSAIMRANSPFEAIRKSKEELRAQLAAAEAEAVAKAAVADAASAASVGMADVPPAPESQGTP
jgi:hypothetical protein